MTKHDETPNNREINFSDEDIEPLEAQNVRERLTARPSGCWALKKLENPRTYWIVLYLVAPEMKNFLQKRMGSVWKEVQPKYRNGKGNLNIGRGTLDLRRPGVQRESLAASA
jgi:hypothetical protein